MAADDSLTAKKPQGSNVICLEIERVKKGGEGKGLGRHLSAADQVQIFLHSTSWRHRDGVYCFFNLLKFIPS